MAATVIFLTTTGAGTWTVPSDWNNANNSIEVIGGGGGGGSYNNGGGGGGYSKVVNVTLTPGAGIAVNVGAGGAGGPRFAGNGGAGGDTWFGNAVYASATVGAKGGAGGVSDNLGNAALGGAAASGIGSTKNSGGNGGTRISGPGGGGGGAAGPNGSGANGGSPSASSGQAGSGGGGSGGGTTGSSGTSTNGGAGGSNSSSAGSGAGGTVGSQNGGAGTAGGGGGGTYNTNAVLTGGAGGAGAEWDATHGAGGGGGGLATGNPGTSVAGVGGKYGGGGGGSTDTSEAVGGAGAQGIIVITYTPGGAPDITGTLAATLSGAYTASIIGTVQLPPQPMQPGGGGYRKPIIYVDEKGRPVDLKTFKVRTANEVMQAAKVAEPRPFSRTLARAIAGKNNEEIAAEARRLAAVTANARLAELLDRLEQLAILEAEQDEGAALMLLLAS